MIQPFKQQLIEGTPTEMLLKEASRINSPIARENIVKMIANHLNVPIGAVRQEFSQYKENTMQTDVIGPYTAKFEGLVEVVAKDEKSMFLTKEGDELKRS